MTGLPVNVGIFLQRAGTVTKRATAEDAEDAENTHKGRLGRWGWKGRRDVRGCGGDEPWSAAFQSKLETATQANRSRRRPDVPGVDAREGMAAEERFPPAR